MRPTAQPFRHQHQGTVKPVTRKGAPRIATPSALQAFGTGERSVEGCAHYRYPFRYLSPRPAKRHGGPWREGAPIIATPPVKQPPRSLNRRRWKINPQTPREQGGGRGVQAAATCVEPARTASTLFPLSIDPPNSRVRPSAVQRFVHKKRSRTRPILYGIRYCPLRHASTDPPETPAWRG